MESDSKLPWMSDSVEIMGCAAISTPFRAEFFGCAKISVSTVAGTLGGVLKFKQCKKYM